MSDDLHITEVVALLEVIGLKKRVGDFSLKRVDLRVRRGEYFVLLGPNGAGKTLLLELIAGIKRPDEGRIIVGNRDVTDLPPERRNVGYIPQSYALFPHMTVFDNIAFGLRIRNLPLDRVNRLAGALGITHLLHRKPTTLSEGERQRVAIARALAIEPEIMLLDEPMSNIDPHTRWSLMDEMRRWHSELEFTAIHVTHNFEEALRLADRVGIMISGELVQVGDVENIFRAPANERVAKFLGFNVLNGRILGMDGSIAVKPEDIVFDGDIPAKVISVDWTGLCFRITLNVDGKEVIAVSKERPREQYVKISFRNYVRV